MLVDCGAATDISDSQELPANLHTLVTSSGLYGINGALFKQEGTDKLFAITKRSGNLLNLI